jgi:hypothetical protein
MWSRMCRFNLPAFAGIGALDIFNHSKSVTLTNTSSSASLTIQNVLVNGPVSAGTPVYQIERSDFCAAESWHHQRSPDCYASKHP